MKDIKLIVCNRPFTLVENEINVIVYPDDFCNIEIQVPDELNVLSYNLNVKGVRVITTNDFVGELPYFNLTKAYLDSIGSNIEPNLILDSFD